MPALVAGIHVSIFLAAKAWMAGTTPGHDDGSNMPTSAVLRRHVRVIFASG